MGKKKRAVARGGEYWTVFYYGGALTLCSRHRTPEAADRAATRCEKSGGTSHILLYVEELEGRVREVQLTRLRNERLRRGWTLTKVTQVTGISTADLSQVERGLRPAFPGWQRRLAEAFNLPVSDLFPEQETDERTRLR
jgi:DNA-binding XRE family transcriptional regulator